jgi:hypothetical protein
MENWLAVTLTVVAAVVFVAAVLKCLGLTG